MFLSLTMALATNVPSAIALAMVLPSAIAMNIAIDMTVAMATDIGCMGECMDSVVLLVGAYYDEGGG